VPGTTSNLSLINTVTTSKTVTVSSSATVDRVDLQGAVGKMDLEIANGATLAVANQIIVDANATMNVQSGGVAIASAGISGSGSTSVAAGGMLTAQSIHQTGLTVNGTVKLPIASPHNASATLSVLGQLTIAGSLGNWSGQRDLGNNDLDLQSGSLATVTDQVRQGYNASGGYWNGTGITSSAAATDPTFLTALGVIQNNQGGTAIYSATHPFDGITPGPSDILIKYTYYGDANLDGKVDGSDYSRIDNGSLNHLTGWFNGDFNYDGVVNGSDYTLIDNAFNTQGAQLSAEIATPTAQLAPKPA
jgi:hypothetical protein